MIQLKNNFIFTTAMVHWLSISKLNMNFEPTPCGSVWLFYSLQDLNKDCICFKIYYQDNISGFTVALILFLPQKFAQRPCCYY